MYLSSAARLIVAPPRCQLCHTGQADDLVEWNEADGLVEWADELVGSTCVPRTRIAGLTCCHTTMSRTSRTLSHGSSRCVHTGRANACELQHLRAHGPARGGGYHDGSCGRFHQLYEPSLPSAVRALTSYYGTAVQALTHAATPILYVGLADNVLGRVLLMPLFLLGNSTPTILHQLRQHRCDKFPHGLANLNAANASDKMRSEVYEVNQWLWQFGWGKPRLGGLSVAATEEQQCCCTSQR